MAPNVFINSPDSSFSAKWCQHSVINVDKALWCAVSVQFHRTEFSDKLSPTGAPTLSSTLPNGTMDFFNFSYLTVATLESTTLWPLEDTSQLRDKARQQTWISSCLLTLQEMKPQCRQWRMRGSGSPFEKECRGATMGGARAPVRKLLWYFCLGVLQSGKGLGWRRPRS